MSHCQKCTRHHTGLVLSSVSYFLNNSKIKSKVHAENLVVLMRYDVRWMRCLGPELFTIYHFYHFQAVDKVKHSSVLNIKRQLANIIVT